jgi:uncharacterized protein YbjT (DUF2867 family)
VSKARVYGRQTMPDQPSILVCGATGALGSRIVRGLVGAGIRTRALVRPQSDAAALEALGVEVVRGDLRDRQSLEPAVAGVATIISTANSIGRRFAGERDLSMQAVDDDGYAALIHAADNSDVGRFVYLSLGGPALLVDSPFSNAKRATEARLRRSPMHEVIVRPDAYQELWFSSAVGFDPAAGKVMIFGRGLSRVSYVGMDDVAAVVVALAKAADPPHLVELGGPEAMTRIEAAEAFASAMGRPIQRRHIPRVALRIGSLVLRRAKPELASSMAMGLAMDTADSGLGPQAFAELGIEPRSVQTYIAEVAPTLTSA